MNRYEQPNGTRVCTNQRESWAAGVLYFVVKSGTASVLLLKRSDCVDHPATWGCPGGFGGQHESPFEAAFREAYEETAYSGGTYRDMCVQRGSDVQVYFTLLTEVEEAFIPDLNHENTDWFWFSLAQLEEAELHPGFASNLKEIKQRIRHLLNTTQD